LSREKWLVTHPEWLLLKPMSDAKRSFVGRVQTFAALFPARDHLALLADIPLATDLESAALAWALKKADANEEVLVAFKVSEKHLTTSGEGLPPSLVDWFPFIGRRRVLILRLAAFALVVLGDQWGAQTRRADVTAQQNQRLGAALRTPADFADCPAFLERVAD
jgi:hypothetical protein